jgi:hypothetical protein
MGIVAKAAGVGDGVQRLARPHRGTVLDKTRRVLQTNQMYEMTARHVPRRKQLLKVTQRDARFDSHLVAPEIRIGKAIPDNRADTLEQLSA